MSRRGKSGDNPEIQIPVTPMLDMAFQLLTFFIFTYHPSAMEGQMDFSIPPPDKAARADSVAQMNLKEESKKDEEPELPPDVLTVKASTQHDGESDGKICALTVEGSAGARTVPVDKDLSELVKYLETARKNLPLDPKTQEPTTLIKIQGDSRLFWREIVRLVDACKAAGFTTHKFVVPLNFVPGGRI